MSDPIGFGVTGRESRAAGTNGLEGAGFVDGREARKAGEDRRARYASSNLDRRVRTGEVRDLQDRT